MSNWFKNSLSVLIGDIRSGIIGGAAGGLAAMIWATIKIPKMNFTDYFTIFGMTFIFIFFIIATIQRIRRHFEGKVLAEKEKRKLIDLYLKTLIENEFKNYEKNIRKIIKEEINKNEEYKEQSSKRANKLAYQIAMQRQRADGKIAETKKTSLWDSLTGNHPWEKDIK